MNTPPCPQCASVCTVKNGFIHTGKQRYPCKTCHRQFVLNPARAPIPQATQDQVEKLLVKRVSLRGICRVLDFSRGQKIEDIERSAPVRCFCDETTKEPTVPRYPSFESQGTLSPARHPAHRTVCRGPGHDSCSKRRAVYPRHPPRATQQCQSPLQAAQTLSWRKRHLPGLAASCNMTCLKPALPRWCSISYHGASSGSFLTGPIGNSAGNTSTFCYSAQFGRGSVCL